MSSWTESVCICVVIYDYVLLFNIFICHFIGKYFCLWEYVVVHCCLKCVAINNLWLYVAFYNYFLLNWCVVNAVICTRGYPYTLAGDGYGKKLYPWRVWAWVMGKHGSQSLCFTPLACLFSFLLDPLLFIWLQFNDPTSGHAREHIRGKHTSRISAVTPKYS